MPGSGENMGWARIAWTYAFISLQDPDLKYQDILKNILFKGGDTDTNACIVGGLLGAKIGFAELKKQVATYVDTVLGLEPTTAKQKRPDWMCSAKAFDLIDQLATIAPKQLKLEGCSVTAATT